MTDLDAQDLAHLERAVELSRLHMEAGEGGPFGAVIVRGGRVLAEGWNRVTSTNDPTAHAEVVAIRRACADLGDFLLADATLYSSCEPCPMCLAAAYWARVGRIVFAATREEAAGAGFSDAAIYEEIPKPPAQRAIPTIHAPRASAAAAFAAWLQKADRSAY